MLVMLCTSVAFVKKDACMSARIVLLDTAGLYLMKLRILKRPKMLSLISVTLSHIDDVIIIPSN